MKKGSAKWIATLVSVCGGTFSQVVSAQVGNPPPTPLNLINPLSGSNINNFGDLVTKVGAFLLALAVPLCGIMVIVGGFQMMTSAGDPAKFKSGRQTLVYAAIGFVIVLFASSVVPVLKSILGG